MRQIDVTCEIENSRRLRLKLLLLQDDNDGLKVQLTQSDDYIDDLEESLEQAANQISAQGNEIDRLNEELRVSLRSHDVLKVCQFLLLAEHLLIEQGRGRVTSENINRFYKASDREIIACT